MPDVCVIGNNSQRALVCNWRVHRKYRMEAPELHKINSGQKALCNRCPAQLGNLFPNHKDVCVCVIILVPIVCDVSSTSGYWTRHGMGGCMFILFHKYHRHGLLKLH